MEIKQIESFTLKGLSTRTTNASELEPSTAKIGALWESFFTELAPNLSTNSNPYGVYYSYESGAEGEFNVLAGAEFKEMDSPLAEVTIESGKYLLFTREGEMPTAVIGAWKEIWEYFTGTDCEYTRLCKTDFEKYIGPNKVEVYIGIE